MAPCPEPMLRRFALPAFGCVLALLLSVIFFNCVFRGWVCSSPPGFGDVPDQFLPWRIFVSERIGDGEIPLWNRFSFCGAPFLANMQSAVLYPVDRFLDLLFQPGHALMMGLVVHLWLGGLFVFALARRFGACTTGAAVAAIGYTLGGFHAIHIFGGNLLTVTSSIFLPGHLYVVVVLSSRVEKGQRLGWVPFLGVVLATLQVLSGHAQMAFYNAFFVTVFVVGLLVLMKGGRLRFILHLAAIGVTATLLAAPQILPTFEYARTSSRMGPLPYAPATEFSFGWEFLLSFLLPEYLGTRADAFTSLRTDTYWGDWKNWSAVYLGALPAFGCLYLYGTKQNRSLGWRLLSVWGGLLVVSLVLSLGRNTPVYYWVHYYLPLFGKFRAPSKFLPGLVVPVAVIGAVGLSRFLEESKKKSATLCGLHPLVAAVCGIFGVLLLAFFPFVSYAFGPIGLLIGNVLRTGSILALGVGGTLLALAIQAGMGERNGKSSSLSKESPMPAPLDSRFRGNDGKRDVFPGRHPRESGDPEPAGLFQRTVRRWLASGPALVLVLMAVLDMGLYFKKYVITAPVEAVKRFPSELVRSHLPEHQRLLTRPEIPQITPEVPQIAWCIPEGIPAVGGYDPFQVGCYVKAFQDEGFITEDTILDAWSPPPTWASRLGAGLILSSQLLRDSSIQPLAKEKGWFLYSVEDPEPLVEFKPNSETDQVETSNLFCWNWEGQNLVVKGNAPSDGYLIVRQTYVPGWVARTGQDSVVKAEFEEPFWQRYPVSAGEIDLVLTYEPWGWKAGKALFPCGLLVLLIGAVVVGTRDHRLR